jgi:hypothetical protein
MSTHVRRLFVRTLDWTVFKRNGMRVKPNAWQTLCAVLMLGATCRAIQAAPQQTQTFDIPRLENIKIDGRGDDWANAFSDDALCRWAN